MRVSAAVTFLALLALRVSAQGQEVEEDFFGTPVRISLGGHAGYGMVNMQEMNAAVREVGTIRQAVNAQGETADLLDGGFYWDASVILRMNRVLFGLGLSSLETNGESTFQQGFFLSDQLSGRATEIFALIGVRIPSDGALFLDLLAGGGLAMATMDYRGEFRDFFDPTQNIVFNHSLESNFFSARVLASAGLLAGPVSVVLMAGYRFADAGVMTGTTERNGQVSQEESPFVDFRGREISFDFSGVILGGGVFVEF